MSSTRAEAALDFVQALLAHEGSARVQAASSSMWPLIRPGDELRLGALDPGAARPGMIVAYQRDGVLIVHRLLRVTPAGLVTKGDALADADAPVTERELVARVATIRSPAGRVLELGRFPWPLVAGVLAGVARRSGANTIVWKALRVPFYLAAALGR